MKTIITIELETELEPIEIYGSVKTEMSNLFGDAVKGIKVEQEDADN